MKRFKAVIMATKVVVAEEEVTEMTWTTTSMTNITSKKVLETT